MDLSSIVGDPLSHQHAEVNHLVDLLRKQTRCRSLNKRNDLRQQILNCLNLHLDIEYAPGEIFEGCFLSVPVTAETSTIEISLDSQDEMGYQLNGDIWFELSAKIDLTDDLLQHWEATTGGIQLPAFTGGLGEYAVDSGSQIGWEILEH